MAWRFRSHWPAAAAALFASSDVPRSASALCSSGNMRVCATPQVVYVLSTAFHRLFRCLVFFSSPQKKESYHLTSRRANAALSGCCTGAGLHTSTVLYDCHMILVLYLFTRSVKIPSDKSRAASSRRPAWTGCARRVAILRRAVGHRTAARRWLRLSCLARRSGTRGA